MTAAASGPGPVLTVDEAVAYQPRAGVRRGTRRQPAEPADRAADPHPRRQLEAMLDGAQRPL
jgi:hypothetical protein